MYFVVFLFLSVCDHFSDHVFFIDYLNFDVVRINALSNPTLVYVLLYAKDSAILSSRSMFGRRCVYTWL